MDGDNTSPTSLEQSEVAAIAKVTLGCRRKKTDGVNTFGGDILMIRQTVIDEFTSFRE
jgi:hypothetical protein